MTTTGHNTWRFLFLLIAWNADSSSVRAGVSAQGEFDGWNLETGVNQAHLVMVARLKSIGKLTVVEGAKTNLSFREFRFTPVRTLKGIFHRDQLTMTAADLGLSAENTAAGPPLKEGEYRLLILAQQGAAFGGMQTFGCVSASPGATTFEERVPRVNGLDDPLVAVVETLIKISESRSRRERAKLLIDRLADTEGIAAVPLLTSLEPRADWAAADKRCYALVARLMNSRETAVRSAAINVLREMLPSGAVPESWKPENGPANLQQLDTAGDALRAFIKSDEANANARVAALDALGNWLALSAVLAAEGKTPGVDFATRDTQIAPTREVLIKQALSATTYAERMAAVAALAKIEVSHSIGTASNAIYQAVESLPLDEPAVRESVYLRALVRYLPSKEARKAPIDSPSAERVLLDRFKRSIAARQSIESEVDALGLARSKESVPLLLAAAENQSVSQTDLQHIADAFGGLRDERTVPVLINWLSGSDYGLKDRALTALENIQLHEKASGLKPLLKTESLLPYKLRIARLLAANRMGDGTYKLVVEHLTDPNQRAAAALVLASLTDSSPAEDLSEILKSSPDQRMRAAALVGLAAMGKSDSLKQVGEILADDRSPLITDAIEAAGVSGDGRLLEPLSKLVQSRSKRISQAALVALGRLLSGVRSSPHGLAALRADDIDAADGDSRAADDVDSAPKISDQTRAAIAGVIDPMVADPYVDADLRKQAFAVARLLGGERYNKLLDDLADQAELEGSPLLALVKAERRRLREVTKKA